MRARWAVALTAALTACCSQEPRAPHRPPTPCSSVPATCSTTWVPSTASEEAQAETPPRAAEGRHRPRPVGRLRRRVHRTRRTPRTGRTRPPRPTASDRRSTCSRSRPMRASSTSPADSDGPVTPEQLGADRAAADPARPRRRRLARRRRCRGRRARPMPQAAIGAGGGATGGGIPGRSDHLPRRSPRIAVIVIVLVVRSRRKKVGGAPGRRPRGRADRPEGTSSGGPPRPSSRPTTPSRPATQELGFAKAQFGDAATVEFEQALADGAARTSHRRSRCSSSSTTRPPDTEEQIRAWNAEIIAAVRGGERRARREGRGVRRAAQARAERAGGARPRAGAARARRRHPSTAREQRLRTLAAGYAPEALATVADNPEQARQRIAFADEQLAAAEAAIGAGKGGEAAVGIRAAEEAVGQAVLLEDAIDKLGHDLAEGEQSAAALIAELEQDIARGIRSSRPRRTGRRRDRRDAAADRCRAGEPRRNRAAPAADAAEPRGRERRRSTPSSQGVRDAAAKAQRAQQMVGQLIMQAQAQVSAAEDYITARRGAVGAEARTRLAEAGASLVQAQQLQAARPAAGDAATRSAPTSSPVRRSSTRRTTSAPSTAGGMRRHVRRRQAAAAAAAGCWAPCSAAS